MEPTSKRTRVVKGQSKHGCFTCKGRKIKCDERKPTCIRCQQSQLECEGYPPSAYRFNAAETSIYISRSSEKFQDHIPSLYNSIPSISGPIQAPSNFDSTHRVARERLVQIGLDVLLNSYRDELAIGQTNLRRLISTHITSSPSVNAVCVALGAAINLQTVTSWPHNNPNLAFEAYYGQAVKLVKQEIESSWSESDTILTSCLLLSAVEILLRRRQNALTHLRGGYRSLRLALPLSLVSCQALSSSPTCNEPAYGPLIEVRSSHDVDIELLLRIFDTQTLSFSEGARPPEMQPVPIQILTDPLLHDSSKSGLDRYVVKIIHACLACINKTALQPVGAGPDANTDLAYVDHMSLLPKAITLLVSKLVAESHMAEREHLIVLCNLCLSVLIQMQGLSAETETAWDIHAKSFQEIISSTEAVLEDHVRWKDGRSQPSTVGFTPQLSVMWSLRIAALKYRDKKWRRRAIKCLRQVEREGPWIGEEVAALAERIMDIEESYTTPSNSDTLNVSSDNLCECTAGSELDAMVPERGRVALVSTMEANGTAIGTFWPSADSGITVIKILRRRRPSAILSAIVLTSAHFGTTETCTAHLLGKQLDPNTWEQWHERIEFSPGKKYSILPAA